MKTNSLFRLLAGKGALRTNGKILLSFLIVAFMCGKSFAQSTANLIITPASPIVTQVGQNIAVNVRVDFTSIPANSAANGVSVHLAFDNTKLQVTSITKPAAATFNLESVPLEPLATINANGQVNYEVGTLGAPASTDFDILTINFDVIAGTGTSTPLTLRRDAIPNFSDVQFGSSILVAPFVVNGSVAITTGSCGLTGATISNSSTCNGQPFDLILQSISGTGTSPYSLVVNGTTYNNVNVGDHFAAFTPPTYTILNTPGTPPVKSEDAPLELGVKFQSSVPGFIKGMRFFADDDPDLAGVYTGYLRAADGTQLATGTLTVTGASQWFSVTFATPVEIAANTTYIVSYHTTGITHPETAGGLTGAINNPPSPLTSLAGGGVFRYDGPDPNPFNASNNNYWADAIFVPMNYSFDLTSVTDAAACNITGTPLQTLNVTSINCNLLPITLQRLSATPENKNVILSWTTANEFENKGFEIQRSTGTNNWEGIGFVAGAGNSVTEKNYTYVDKDLFPRRYFYRLKQTDFDGKYKYSGVVAATIDGKADFVLSQNYPNPFRTETTIQYTLAQKSNVKITIMDMHGRIVKTLVNSTRDIGTHIEYFYPRNLTPGLYFYKLEAGAFNTVKKMIIQ